MILHVTEIVVYVLKLTLKTLTIVSGQRIPNRTFSKENGTVTKRSFK